MAVSLLPLSDSRLLSPEGCLIFFYYGLITPLSYRAAGRIKLIKNKWLIENLIRSLPACDIVPQPTTLRRASTN
jgi:hypothetical protein